MYPEVLYTVARYWHELYLRQASEEDTLDEPAYRAPPPLAVPLPYPLAYPFAYHPYPPPIYQLQVTHPPQVRYRTVSQHKSLMAAAMI